MNEQPHPVPRDPRAAPLPLIHGRAEAFLEWIDQPSGVIGTLAFGGSAAIVLFVLAVTAMPTAGATRSTRLELEARARRIEREVAAGRAAAPTGERAR